MSELRPCPACHGPANVFALSVTDEGCVAYVECDSGVCLVSGPRRTRPTRREAIDAVTESWNALPREERWVPVAESLPEPRRGFVFDIAFADGRVEERVARFAYCGGVRWMTIFDLEPDAAPTHWRLHPTPRGPEEA